MFVLVFICWFFNLWIILGELEKFVIVENFFGFESVNFKVLYFFIDILVIKLFFFLFDKGNIVLINLGNFLFIKVKYWCLYVILV